MNDVASAYKSAMAADAAFDKAIRDAGYRSRWDWSQLTDRRPLAAYLAKVKADEALHAAFEAERAKSPGQIAYEQDCAARPSYADGSPRKAWGELSDVVRQTWERHPTPRWTATKAEE